MPYVSYSQVPQETLAVDEGFGKEIKIEVNNEPNTIDLPPIKDRTAGPPPDETRIIHWVHGLKGNKTSWEKVAKVTEDVDEANTVDDWNARDVKSIRHEYRENHSQDVGAIG